MPFVQRGPGTGWNPPLLLATLFALAVCLTACSGISQSSGNSGGAGGSGGSGGSGGGGGNNGGSGGGNLSCNVMATGQGASLNGFVPFTSSNLWNTDISAAAVDPNSNKLIILAKV